MGSMAASNYYSTTSYGVEIYQTTTPVYLRPAPFVLGGTWVYNVGTLGNSNAPTCCLFDGTNLYLNVSNTAGIPQSWFDEITYKTGGYIIVTNTVGDYIRIKYDTFDLSQNVYIAHSVTADVQGSWWWAGVGGNNNVSVSVAYSDYATTNINVGSTVVYDLNAIRGSPPTTDTQFVTIRDYAGQQTQYPLIVSTIGEQSTFRFTEEYKAGVFSAKGVSTYQIANTFGSPLFEGKPRILEMNVADIAANNINSAVTTVGRATVNTIITNKNSYLRRLYTGDFSTINALIAGGLSNKTMICALPYSSLLTVVGDAVLTNVSISGELLATQGGFLGETTFRQGISGITNVSSYTSQINYGKFVVNRTFDAHNVPLPAITTTGPTYAVRTETELASIGRLESPFINANQLTVVGTSTYMDRLNMSTTTLQTAAGVLDISEIAVTMPYISTGMLTSQTLEASTLLFGNRIIYNGPVIIVPNLPISNVQGSLVTNTIDVSAVNVSTSYIINGSSSTLTTSSMNVRRISTPAITCSDTTSIMMRTTVLSAAAAAANMITASNVTATTFNDSNHLFSNVRGTLIPSQIFALYSANSSNVYTNALDCSSVSLQTISATDLVTFQGTVSSYTLRSSNVYTSSIRAILENLPNLTTLGDIPQTTLYPSQYIYKTYPTIYYSGQTSPRLPFIDNMPGITFSYFTSTFPYNPNLQIYTLVGSQPCEIFYKFKQTIPFYPVQIINAWYGVLKNVPGQGINVTTLIQNYLNTVADISVNDVTFGYTGPPLFGNYYLWIDFYPANRDPAEGILNYVWPKDSIVYFVFLGTSKVSITFQNTKLLIDLQDPLQREGSFFPTITGTIMTINEPFPWREGNGPIQYPLGRNLPVYLIPPLSATFFMIDPTVNYLDTTHAIIMESDVIRWPYCVSTVTIDNKYNDMNIRNIFYLGSLNSASDVRLKEDIQEADLGACCTAFDQIDLKRFKWIDSYLESHRPADTHVLGILATDVAEVLPKSVQKRGDVSVVDSEQLEMIHMGVTKTLQDRLAALEEAIRLG